MLETAAALLIAEPLVGVVFPRIAGGVAHAIFKKLWDLPRESVDELEVALLKAAFDAVVDCCTQALGDKESPLSREQQKAINARISKFRKIAKKAHKLPEQYVADMVRLSDAAPPPGSGRPLTRFGPLVVHACQDMPEPVPGAFDDHFADELQKRFNAQLRDNERVSRLFMAEAVTGLRAKRYLADAESRADYAGYRLIHADIHVARAQLAKLAGDTPAMHELCEKAIAICNDPTCDYAWAKQDAERLLEGSD